MIAYGQTDVGRVRTLNEDSLLLPGPGERFCAVADGMGGANAGEVASAMAVELLAKELRALGEVSRDALGRIVRNINRCVYEHSRDDDDLSGMGTTLTALVRKGERAYIAQVGDSRCYRLRKGGIEQVTKDQSYVQELVDAGLITQEMAKYHPMRNLITGAIGSSDGVEPELLRLEWQPGDVYFLCSDGLTNHIDPEDIAEVAREPWTWPEKLNRLVRYALEDGGTDNITAIFAMRREDAQ